MIRLLLSLIALCFALPAAAHETTRSYLTLQSDGPAVTADLRLAYRDIEVAVWMDENLDGQITWGEAKARLGAVTSYVLANVSLSDPQGACKLTLQDQSSLTDAGVDYLQLSFTGTCPGKGSLTLHSSLFTDIDPDHRMFVTAVADHARTTALISRTDPDLVLDQAATGWGATFAAYFRAGVDHLVEGTDHIVFLLALMLPFVCSARSPRSAAGGILAAVTGFTLAHALTLTAAATDLLRPNTGLIEALIALSIIVTAADNIRPFLPLPRAAVAAFFGTIHGFGFASALGTLNLGGAALATALLGFNLGIEAAQVGLVLLTMPVLYLLGAGKRVVWVGSGMAGLVGVFWLVQRLPGLI